MKDSNVIFKFRISNNMLKTLCWLGLSTVCFILLAIETANASNGALGRTFFMMITLLQVYNISLHLKIHLLTDGMDHQLETLDVVVDLVKTFADRKTAVLTPEQLKQVALVASDIVYTKMQEKVDKTAAELRSAILDDDDASEVAQKALKAIKHVGKAIRKKEAKDDLPTLTKWKIKD